MNSTASASAAAAAYSENKIVNILYIIDYLASPGGTERHLSYLTRHLDRSRFRCFVVPFYFEPTPMTDAMIAAGTLIEYIRVARYYAPKALLQALRLARFIRANNIDIVQTFHYKADVYGALVARLAGVKHIVSSKRDAADYKGPFRFFLHKLIRPLTERYIAVSDVVAEVIRLKEGVDANKMVTIHNGVDTQHYRVPNALEKIAAKERIGFSAENFVIGMSAWFRPEKDHQLLLDCFLELHRQYPALRLLLIGGGPLLETFKIKMASHITAGIIHFSGPVTDVAPLLQALDVACLVPHINEGFSNSVLEKMATGLPLIVTDIGGNKEAIAHGENGFVIAARDAEKLRSHLIELYCDPELRRRMGAASRERVLQRFSLQQMLKQHEALYEEMMRAR